MHWYPDVLEKRIVGYDIGSFGVSKWTSAFEVRYNKGAIETELTTLGGLARAVLPPCGSSSPVMQGAVECLVRAFPEDSGMFIAFSEYLNTVPEVFWTIGANYSVREHSTLNSECSIINRTLRFSESEGKVAVYSPQSFYPQTPEKVYTSEREAITVLTSKIREESSIRIHSWDRVYINGSGS